jgi:D-beta-D-heptose 7-phosphate kinase/D-beta-D-heptose 1-phosphate adenosyltransferase
MRLPSPNPERPPRVLVIGDLMLDRYLWGSCDRISPEAPVQVVKVQRETHCLGGAGNVATNLRSLGAEVSLIALVGADAPSTPLARLMQDLGVGADGLVSDPARPTSIKTRVLAAHHQLLRFDVERAEPCSAAHAQAMLDGLQRKAADTDVVVLSDYGKGVLTPSLTRELIAHCRKAGLPVLVDPKGRDYAHYLGATLLTPNRKEAAAATGLDLTSDAGIASAGRQLLSRLELTACLITLSEDGMALFEAAGEQRLPTQAREVFDVTGAGDTVIAAIAFALACGLPLLEACDFANGAAGVVVGKLGAASVTLDEIARAAGNFTGREAKLRTRDELLREVTRLRAAGRSIVFTNGCFDILHAGHVQYLEQAAALGDVLIVGLNSPKRPINPELDRAQLLAALSSVSYVTPFAEDTPRELIASLLPDVLVKGGDYRPDDIAGAAEVRAHGGEVRVLPFVEGRSTSRIIARAAEDKS